MVLNLESLVKSVYFRSYWVQRNASAIRRYWTGVADLRRLAEDITETRVFLRAPDGPEAPRALDATAVSDLLALVPPEAGLYKASPIGDSSAAATLIVEKLIGVPPQRSHGWR